MFWFQGPSCSVPVIAHRSFCRRTPWAVLCFWLPRVPRALQIKGCWCTHHHMLGCWLKHHISPCPVGQQAISHDPGCPCMHWCMLEGKHLRDVRAAFDMTVATVETLWAEPAVDLQTPAACTALSVVPSERLWHASESGQSWKCWGHMDSLCFQVRCPPNFLGMREREAVDPTFVFREYVLT